MSNAYSLSHAAGWAPIERALREFREKYVVTPVMLYIYPRRVSPHTVSISSEYLFTCVR